MSGERIFAYIMVFIILAPLVLAFLVRLYTYVVGGIAYRIRRGVWPGELEPPVPHDTWWEKGQEQNAERRRPSQ